VCGAADGTARTGAQAHGRGTLARRSTAAAAGAQGGKGAHGGGAATWASSADGAPGAAWSRATDRWRNPVTRTLTTTRRPNGVVAGRSGLAAHTARRRPRAGAAAREAARERGHGSSRARTAVQPWLPWSTLRSGRAGRGLGKTGEGRAPTLEAQATTDRTRRGRGRGGTDAARRPDAQPWQPWEFEEATAHTEAEQQREKEGRRARAWRVRPWRWSVPGHPRTAAWWLR